MSSLILHGRRFFELEKWRHLRFTMNVSFSTAADVSLHLQDGPKGHNFTVSNYLVESLGFTTKLAESISREVSFNDKVNPDSVLSHRFSDLHHHYRLSTSAYSRWRSLAPKLQFLKSRGASTSELTEVNGLEGPTGRLKDKLLDWASRGIVKYFTLSRGLIKSNQTGFGLVRSDSAPDAGSTRSWAGYFGKPNRRFGFLGG
ncbi:unnamed protein product [Brassica oleracea var. botrytis]